MCIFLIGICIWGICKRKDAENALYVQEVMAESTYDASREIQEALQQFEEEVEPADLVADEDTLEKYIGLAFQGLADTTTNQKIITLLKTYDRKATFFLPAIEAVECEEDVIDIVEAGHEIGSNSLRGEAHLEQLSREEVVNNLCVANKVIKTITDQRVLMLQGTATVYTEEVLKAARACGNEKVVYCTQFINYQSFQSYEQVLGYVEKLPRGTILTIKMQGVLDEIELEEQEVEEKPEKDMQPTIDPNKEAFLELFPEERIVTIVEWILQALEETNYQTKNISDFAINNDVNTEKIYDEELVATEQPIDKKATVHTVVVTNKSYVGLQVQGIVEEEKVRDLLQVLKDTKQSATFYVTAEEIMDYPQLIQEIIDAGCHIGNGGLSAEKLTDKSYDEVVDAIRTCNELLKEKFGVKTSFFMPPQGQYDETVQQAALDENMTLVTFTKGMVVAKGQTVEQKVSDLKKSLAKGKIYFVNISKNENVDEVLKGFIQSVKDKKYQIVDIDKLFATKTTDTTIQILSATEIASLRQKNGGRKAATIKQVYTTERALSMSFSGIKNTAVVQSIIDTMTLMQGKATFFVTYEEMKTYPNQVKAIVNSGNEIGIAFVPSNDTTFAKACNEIAVAQDYMYRNYGVKPDIVMNTVSRTKNETKLDIMREAISAMNCKLIGNSVSVIQSGLVDCVTAEEYYTGLTKSNFYIQMGHIVYTRLDYLTHPEILPEVLVRLKQDKIDPIAYYDKQLGQYMWAYQIKKVSDVVNNTADQGTKLYQLNSGEGAENYISYNHVDLSNHTNLMNMIKTRYIGNPNVGDSNSLPGFVQQEIDIIDKSGKMYGNQGDGQVFLTFDDWGTDKALNHLLYVLDKYQIKATFFVRSNHVQSNPNLLREIAVLGHEVGSHTSAHIPLSNVVETKEENTYLYESLTAEQAVELRNDLVKSYRELYQIIGDVNVNGHMALVPIFRPPTLAVSKVGLLQVFETGYQYCISGDFSTTDYKYNKANNGIEQLADKLQNGLMAWNGKRTIQSHSIVIMHMSDESEATPEAIEQWMHQGIRQKYRFDIPMYQYMTTY